MKRTSDSIFRYELNWRLFFVLLVSFFSQVHEALAHTGGGHGANPEVDRRYGPIFTGQEILTSDQMLKGMTDWFTSGWRPFLDTIREGKKDGKASSLQRKILSIIGSFTDDRLTARKAQNFLYERLDEILEVGRPSFERQFLIKDIFINIGFLSMSTRDDRLPSYTERALKECESNLRFGKFKEAREAFARAADLYSRYLPSPVSENLKTRLDQVFQSFDIGERPLFDEDYSPNFNFEFTFGAKLASLRASDVVNLATEEDRKGGNRDLAVIYEAASSLLSSEDLALILELNFKQKLSQLSLRVRDHEVVLDVHDALMYSSEILSRDAFVGQLKRAREGIYAAILSVSNSESVAEKPSRHLSDLITIRDWVNDKLTAWSKD